MRDGSFSAIRRFPANRATIEMMIERDEEFRVLCEDLAEAGAALLLWQCQNERLIGCTTLVAGLSAEIKAALASSLIGSNLS
jgi:hypothetical protein